jgi:ribonuclease PH
MTRVDGRRPEDLRPVTIETGAFRNAEGSARVTSGETVVLCAATVEERVPAFLKGSGRGWVTAEYGMLPRSSGERIAREASQGRQGGRTLEIQRMIGRAIRPVVDLASLGERTVLLDCDVLEADGGTRTAAVTGAAVALHQALTLLVEKEKIAYHPMRELVSAVSVGIVGGEVLLDLCYEEDVRAEVDLNVVVTATGKLIEVQGTAEREAFAPEQLARMVALAVRGCEVLHRLQRGALPAVERG